MISDVENKELAYGPKNSSKQDIKLNKLKDISISFDNLKYAVITGVDEPNINLKVFTDLNEDIKKVANIKISESKTLDISISHKKAKKTPDSHLYLRLCLPYKFLGDLELEGKVEDLTLYHCMHSHTEFGGDVNKIMLFDLKGAAEIDSNSHMEIIYDGSLTQLDINQINSSSNLILAKGSDTYIYASGKECDIVLIGCVNNPNSQHRIELNGKKSHLIARNE